MRGVGNGRVLPFHNLSPRYLRVTYNHARPGGPVQHRGGGQGAGGRGVAVQRVQKEMTSRHKNF
jgi:hypothetical protein